MPDGVLQWFDEKAGEGAVVRSGHAYVAREADVEPAARHPGARVHFDVAREAGVERAVEVTLRAGTRTGHRHGRFGTLTGARRPDTKGSAPFARPHPELGHALAGHPLEVALSWADAVSRGERDTAMALCSPELRLHLPGHDLAGRRQLDGWLQQHPALGCQRRAELRGNGDDVEVRWEPNGPDAPVPGVRCRIRHGWVVEQWPLPARPPSTELAVGAGGERLAVETVADADVGPDDLAYGRRRLAQLAEAVAEPILFARLKLSRSHDPAYKRPERAEAVLDVNGDPVRAHVSAGSMHEAIDLLQARLRDQLQHRSERREALRKSSGRSAPGEWRHGAIAPPRPEHFERPVDERELVRLKSFATDELTPDEAVSDMEELDYDFYLFRDLATGSDSLVERDPSGTLLLTRLGSPDAEAGTNAYGLEASGRTPPRLRLEEAIERLNAGGEPFVFFEDAVTGRGSVCYRRYDGHYGLLTPE